MIKFVNAKLNLGLNIVRKRDDGYHDLETLFYPIGIYNGTPENQEPFDDILEIHLHDSDREDEFHFTGNIIDCPPEKNLVCKAVKVFKETLLTKGLNPSAVKMTLEKHLPDGAGLGGGSADASFTLLALNELHGSPLTRKEMIGTAAQLGADCPFFIINSPVIATGIGEIMSPCDVSLEGYWVVILKPDVYVSTKEAFGGIVPKEPEVRINDIVHFPVEEWKERGLSNDFENHIFRKFPILASLKEFLYNNGAIYASMSGSGSSLFGIFKGKEEAMLCKKNVEKFENPPLSFISKL